MHGLASSHLVFARIHAWQAFSVRFRIGSPCVTLACAARCRLRRSLPTSARHVVIQAHGTYARLKPLPHSGHLCKRSLLSKSRQSRTRQRTAAGQVLTGLEMAVEMVSPLVAAVTKITIMSCFWLLLRTASGNKLVGRRRGFISRVHGGQVLRSPDG